MLYDVCRAYQISNLSQLKSFIYIFQDVFFPRAYMSFLDFLKIWCDSKMAANVNCNEAITHSLPQSGITETKCPSYAVSPHRLSCLSQNLYAITEQTKQAVHYVTYNLYWDLRSLSEGHRK